MLSQTSKADDSYGACFRRISRTLIYTLTIFTIILMEVDTHENDNIASSDTKDNTSLRNVKRSIEGDTPIILWWTGRLYFGSGIKKIKCGLQKENVCYSTNQRTYFQHSNVRMLWFYGTDLDPEDMPLPRLPQHEWALFHEESPMNNYMLVHTPMITLFNYTATFRRESDFPLSTQNIPSIKYLVNRRPLSIQVKNQLKIEENLAPILYVQSHCDVASDRDRYVKELMKYIQIDSVGSCVNNKKMPPSLQDPVESMASDDFLDYISRYKFHLAFENAICNDYMTEKIFRTLHVGSVPIYRGSPLIQDWMPDNHSVIVTDDFASPKELAKMLHHLDSDDEAYTEYLKFKEPGGITNKFLLQHLKYRPYGEDVDMIQAYACFLCTKVHERILKEKKHKEDPSLPLLPQKIAQENHLYCPEPYISVGKIDDYPMSDSWRKHMWNEDYWTGLDKAKALEEIVISGESDSSFFEKKWMDNVRNRYNLYHYDYD